MTALALDVTVAQQAMASAKRKWGEQWLRPIGPHLTALLPLMPQCDLQRRWYVVQTHSQQEETVESEIRKLKIDAYCPREPRMVRVNAVKHKPVRKPILVGYVFAGYDLAFDRWQAIFGLRGVMRMLQWPIGDREMERVRSLEIDRAGGRKANMPKIALKPDDLVRVTKGPFVEMLGFVSQVNEDKHEVDVDLDIFGRKVPLKLPALDVEAV